MPLREHDGCGDLGAGRTVSEPSALHCRGCDCAECLPGFPARATRVYADATVLIERPKYGAEREKRTTIVERSRTRQRSKVLAYQRWYNEQVRPNKRTRVAT